MLSRPEALEGSTCKTRKANQATDLHVKPTILQYIRYSYLAYSLVGGQSDVTRCCKAETRQMTATTTTLLTSACDESIRLSCHGMTVTPTTSLGYDGCVMRV